MADKKWIQDAHLKTGAFTQQANRAGFRDVQVFARYVLSHKDKYSATTIKRAQLAQTFKKMGK